VSFESVRRVALAWPRTGSATSVHAPDAPNLAEIEAAFREWIDEARRRGCPETAPVRTFGVGQQFDAPDLIVQWDATDDVTTGALT
jgi:hypothetical protein